MGDIGGSSWRVLGEDSARPDHAKAWGGGSNGCATCHRPQSSEFPQPQPFWGELRGVGECAKECQVPTKGHILNGVEIPAEGLEIWAEGCQRVSG